MLNRATGALALAGAGAFAFSSLPGLASEEKSGVRFEKLSTVSVLFNGRALFVAEAVAPGGTSDPAASPELRSVWGAAPTPPPPRIASRSDAALSPAGAAPAQTASLAIEPLQAPSGMKTAEPNVDAALPAASGVDTVIVPATTVYAEVIATPPPKVQVALDEGDQRQFRKTLDRSGVETTNQDYRVADLFVQSPDTKETPLSLRDVVLFTLKNNPDIGIAMWQAVDARYAIRGAKAPFLPTVELNGAAGLENSVVANAEDGGAYGLNRREASVRVSQRIFDFGRSGQLLERARALYQSKQLAFDDAVEDTVLAAVSAYLDLLGSTELLENAKSNVREHEAIFNLVKINFEGGNTSEAELNRARTRLDRTRTAALDAENSRENSINNFRRVTQLEPGRLLEPELDVAPAMALNDDTIDAIITRSFGVQSFVRDQHSIEHQLRATRRNYLPEFNLEVTGRYQDNVLGNVNGSTEGRAMVAARWNLYDGGLSASRAAQLRARQRENEQRIVKLRNELREEAFNIISVLRTTEDKRVIFNEQVDSSRRVVELYSKQFEAGRRTLLELLDAQADFAEARQESIANKYENLAASFASLRFQNELTPNLAAQLGFDVP